LQDLDGVPVKVEDFGDGREGDRARDGEDVLVGDGERVEVDERRVHLFTGVPGS